MIEAPSPSLIRVTNTSLSPWAGGRWRLQPGETASVPFECLAQFHGARGLSFDLSQAAEHLATRDAQGRLMFDFWAPISAVDGYGRHALDIFRAIRGLGASPILRDAGWNSLKPRDYEVEAQVNATKLPSRVGLCMSVPYDESLTGHSSVYKVVITQFETNRIPEFHVRAVNRADHLIVTSHFQPDVWRRSGVRKTLPISVLRPGVDIDYFVFRRPEPDGLFKCLILGALTGRKDPLATIRIFQAASRDDESWRLTIKTRFADGLLDVMRALRIAVATRRENDREVPVITMPFAVDSPLDSRIRLVVSDDPPDAIRDYYQGHDCLLWPSKGEGVGLPPLEAMSCGMEVVMSDNSGMADYAWPAHCWPIKNSHMEDADGPGGFSREYTRAFGDVGQWWVPDEAHAAAQLRRAFGAWREGKGKGAKAAAHVRAHHNLVLQGRSVLKVVEQYATA